MASYLQEDENEQGQGSGTNTQSNDKLVTAASPNSGLGGGAPQTVAPKNKTTKFVNLQKFIDSNSNTIKELPSTLTNETKTNTTNTKLDKPAVTTSTQVTNPDISGQINSINNDPIAPITYTQTGETDITKITPYTNYIKTLTEQQEEASKFDTEEEALNYALANAEKEAVKRGMNYTDGMSNLDNLIFGMKTKDIAKQGQDINKTITDKMSEGKAYTEEEIRKAAALKAQLDESLRQTQKDSAEREKQKYLAKLQGQDFSTKEEKVKNYLNNLYNDLKAKYPNYQFLTSPEQFYQDMWANPKPLKPGMPNYFTVTDTTPNIKSNFYSPQEIERMRKLEQTFGWEPTTFNEDQQIWANPEFNFNESQWIANNLGEFDWNTLPTAPPPPPVISPIMEDFQLDFSNFDPGLNFTTGSFGNFNFGF